MKHEKLIEKFLQQKLSLNEEELFKKLIETDPDFKKEVVFQKNLKKAIADADDETFRDYIRELEDAAPTTKKSNEVLKWLIAAGIAVLLGISYFFSLQAKTAPHELFAEYFSPYRNVIRPVERSNTNVTEEDTAFYNYEKGNYQKAVKHFAEGFEKTQKPYFLFYEANAWLQLGKPDKAIPLLKTFSKTDDMLAKKADWYLAMAYLEKGDLEKAREYLQKIMREKSYKFKEAQEILIKLK